MGLATTHFIQSSVFTDTEVVVAETPHAVIVVARGTETAAMTEVSDVVDVLVDGDALIVNGIHRGFKTAAGSVLDAVDDAVGDTTKKVWLTGHSLGGAIATVLAYRLEKDDRADVQGVYTYGAPRALADGVISSTVDDFNGLFAGRAAQRWVNNLDPVPLVPPPIPGVLPYRHIGQTNNIRIGSGTCALVLDDSERALVDWGSLGTALGSLGAAIVDGDAAAISESLAPVKAAVVGVADLGDHDMRRYSARIYAKLPAGSRAVIPPPPAPPAKQVDCDYPDATPPTITPTTPESAGTIGDNGWYTSDVTIEWAVLDGESAAATTGCEPVTLQTDTTGTTYTCTATSNGGTTATSVTVKRDATPPDIAGSVAPPSPDGASGWYVTAPVVSFVCSDTTSGIASCHIDGDSVASRTLGQSAAAQSVSATARDNAGLVTATTVGGLYVDLTDPTVSCPSPPAFVLNETGASLTATVTDLQSGPAASLVTALDVDTDTAGTWTVSVTGTDVAGRSTTVSCPYSVTYDLIGFTSPIDNPPAENVAKAGQTVPVKWRLTDASGSGYADLSTLRFTVSSLPCVAVASDAVEEYASGSSGLQNLGQGFYQFNWKTPLSYANSCRDLAIDLGEGAARHILFRFRR